MKVIPHFKVHHTTKPQVNDSQKCIVTIEYPENCCHRKVYKNIVRILKETMRFKKELFS